MDKDEKKKEKKEKETEEQDEVIKLTEQVKTCEEKYKRALADYQNLEKRTREERVEWIKSSSRDLLLRLLPVLDTLMLAGQHTTDKTIQVTVQQFLDVLTAEGVKRIETVGKHFDAHLMECVETIEGEEGKVVEEVRAGYTLFEKLLRPALVKVGKKAAS